MIEIDTRLRAARGIAKTETQAAMDVFDTLQRRGHPLTPPPVVSDGWGAGALWAREAMVEVYGQVPEYQGRGRPPTLKQPLPGWQYLQVVKQRENGRVVGTELRVIFGQEDEVLRLLGNSTAYVERTHLTMRHFNSRLTRKSLAFSKLLEMHCAAAAFEDFIYNFHRPLSSLRIPEVDHPHRRWRPRTPAMAASITDHIWSLSEIFRTLPFLDP